MKGESMERDDHNSVSCKKLMGSAAYHMERSMVRQEMKADARFDEVRALEAAGSDSDSEPLVVSWHYKIISTFVFIMPEPELGLVA